MEKRMSMEEWCQSIIDYNNQRRERVMQKVRYQASLLNTGDVGTELSTSFVNSVLNQLHLLNQELLVCDENIMAYTNCQRAVLEG